MNLADCQPGLLVIRNGRVFKLAVVVDRSDRTGKARVCVYSATAKLWSQPQLVHPKHLSPLPDRILNPGNEEWSRKRRVLVLAIRDLDEHKGWVTYKGGAHWLSSILTALPLKHGDVVRPSADGITKLSPVAGVVSGKGPLIFSDPDTVRDTINPKLTALLFRRIP